VNLVSDEGIRDTLIDLHNYAAMALMLLDEWKRIVNTPKKDLNKCQDSYVGMTA
jgi:hypothetical protein